MAIILFWSQKSSFVQLFMTIVTCEEGREQSKLMDGIAEYHLVVAQ